MDERELLKRRERTEAWKKTLQERLGRDHLSSVKGYVVAGCVLDILDEIWDRRELKFLTQFEDPRKTQYNVFVYSLIRYPPVSCESKKFID